MPNPAISPASVGATQYTIADSTAAVVDLMLTVPTTPSFPVVSIVYPAAAAVQVALVRGATTLALLPGPIDNNVLFANRRVIASTTPAGPDTVLTIEIRASAAPAAEAWSVRVSGLGGSVCSVEQSDNDPVALTITRVVSAPVAVLSDVSPASPVKEKANVSLTALLAAGTAMAPTVVGGPAPAVTYRWSYTGTIAIPAFPTASASQVFAFEAPGVYGDRTIQLGLEVTYSGGPIPAAFLTSVAATQPLTIQPRIQHLLLLLDRSGSMSGTRWERAKTAAQILTQAFATFRAGVNAADRVGLMVFEDESCGWRPWGAAIDARIAPVQALAAPPAAGAAACGVNFGAPGDCTPIGDGLYKAMKTLDGLGVANDPHFTIVLLTDGYENAGTVRVDPDSVVNGVAVRNFATARNDFPNVNSRLTIYAVGLGGEVQEDVLDALPLPAGAGPAGMYRQVTDVAQLTGAIAQMVSFSQAAEQVVPLAGAPQDTPIGGAPGVPASDPAPEAQQGYVRIDPKVNRLAIAVEWGNPADTLELARRDWNELAQQFSGAFQPVAATISQCTSHGYVSVDVAALFGDEDNVPATEWRIVHRSGGVAQAIASTDLLVFVDLHVSATIDFDRTRYRTGDPMIVTARLRAGSEPIHNARVRVELARPGESLGTFLATNSARFVGTMGASTAVVNSASTANSAPNTGAAAASGTVPKPRADPARGKQAMLQGILAQLGMTALPIEMPARIFEDDTNQLFDDGFHHDGDAHNGNYANRYTRTDKEGTYTWRLHITGSLPNGSPFSRVIVVSRWVGVQVDPRFTTLVWTALATAPNGMQAATIRVVPRDRFGNYLGPFRSADVGFSTSGGSFDGEMVSAPDGGYVRQLVYPANSRPEVTVTIQGRPMVRTPLAEGCLPQFMEALRSLFR